MRCEFHVRILQRDVRGEERGEEERREETEREERQGIGGRIECVIYVNIYVCVQPRVHV